MAKSLFGRPLRVRLAVWVARRFESPFYLQEAQTAMASLDEAPSAVPLELRRFVDAGMLTETRVASRVYFTPVQSRLWNAFQEIEVAISQLEAPTSRGADAPALRGQNVGTARP